MSDDFDPSFPLTLFIQADRVIINMMYLSTKMYLLSLDTHGAQLEEAGVPPEIVEISKVLTRAGLGAIISQIELQFPFVISTHDQTKMLIKDFKEKGDLPNAPE